MQEKSWEIKEIPAWVSQKGASALTIPTVSLQFGKYWDYIPRMFGFFWDYNPKMFH